MATSNSKNCIFFIFSILCLNSSVFGQTPDDVGQWSTPIPFGIVPVAVANLPDGKLITWSSQFPNTFTAEGDGMTYTELFDPFAGPLGTGVALGEFTANTDHDMFCPGINNLSDGRILSAGGTSSEKTSIYDPQTGLWSVASTMNIPRGYQGNVTLNDGSVFTIGGSWDAGPDGGKDAELWTQQTGWTRLSGITADILYNSNDLTTELRGVYRADNHVWLWPASDGTIFHAGPSERMHWIDPTNSGSSSDAGLRGTDTYSMKGTTVMFDIDKILKVGGAPSYDSNQPAFDTSMVIDISGGYGSTPTVTPTLNTLSESRTMHNSTVLPNGEVLVTGGLDHAEVFTDVGGRLTAELYNPNTNSWRNVAGMANARTYHSVAILMVDGRVFVGGGGLCDSTPDCVNHFDAEIYSPPYLFDNLGNLATRPEITSGPDTTDYNTNISITATTGIQEFSLIRFSAATHSTNNEQRRIPLSFTENTGVYNLSIPQRNILPPGYYMLFGLDINGVPSIAHTIKIGSDIPLSTNTNLVVDLGFNEASGTIAADSSIYGNDGQLIEADDNGNLISLTQNYFNPTGGIFGGALEMNGAEHQSNSLVEIVNSSSLQSTAENITVMAWVKRDEIENNVAILGHDYPTIFFGFHNSLYKWDFAAVNGGIASCYAGYSPSDTWVHIAATYNGSMARLYANGVEICTRISSSPINFDNLNAPYSSFSTSGFFDDRDHSGIPGRNTSGITDELDGKIDEFKVFNKALGPEEIQGFYQLGLNTGNPDITICLPNIITVQYKIGTGDWQDGNNANVQLGDEVYIRAQTPGEYFVTTLQKDGPTFSSVVDFPTFDDITAYKIDTFVDQNGNSERNNGLVDSSNSGQFALTTADGCTAVFTLNVAMECDPLISTQIRPEWRISDSSSYQSGNPGEDVTIYVDETENVRLSILPNGLNFTVTTPSGGMANVDGDFLLNNVSTNQAGVYQLTSEEGCTVMIEVSFDDSPICLEDTIIPEYRIDGVWDNGENSIAVPIGTDLTLSMLPNSTAFTLTLPDGTVVGDNYNLGNVDATDSGDYTFTTAEGCTEVLAIQVGGPLFCTDDDIIPEYRIDGVWDSGENSIAVPIGTDIALSMIPNATAFTLTLPDGTVVGDNYNLGNVDATDSGDYTFTTAEGCTEVLAIQVGGPLFCTDDDIIPEYRIDGVWDSGENSIAVPIGTDIALSMIPNATAFTLTLPDGTVVGDNYNLGNVDATDNGDYTFTTAEGCTEVLAIQVGGPLFCTDDDIIPEYRIDGVWDSGENSIAVPIGTDIALSMIPNATAFTLTLPDGTVVGDNYNLGNVDATDSGDYTFTTAEGCTEVLALQVGGPLFCTDDDIIPEYSINGINDNGLNSITINQGDELILSMLPDTTTFTLTLPDGTVVGDNYNLGNVDATDNGDYTFTTAEGCTEVLNVMVTQTQTCTDDDIIPEYSINGTKDDGLNSITINQGDELILSMLPDTTTFTLTLPDGTVVGDNYNLGNVDTTDSGDYTFTTAEGCTEVLNVMVTQTQTCTDDDIIPEYSINGTKDDGLNSITINQGDELILSMLPDTATFTLTLPDGIVVGDNYNLGNVDTTDSGDYTFTTAEGCTEILNVMVELENKPNSEATINDIIIYPNPVRNNILNINLSDFMDESILVGFYDIYGKLISQEIIPKNHEHQVKIDISILSTGIYLTEIVRIKYDNQLTFKKVIKVN